MLPDRAEMPLKYATKGFILYPQIFVADYVVFFCPLTRYCVGKVIHT